AVLRGMKQELDVMIPLVNQVLRQTTARVFRGVTDTPGKIVSVFEPTAEIIRKGKVHKPTEFGKLVKIQEAENQIITHYAVCQHRRLDFAAGSGAPPSATAGAGARIGGRRCRFLLSEKRTGGTCAGSAAGLDPESFDPERGATEAPKETLVPQ